MVRIDKKENKLIAELINVQLVGSSAKVRTQHCNCTLAKREGGIRSLREIVRFGAYIALQERNLHGYQELRAAHNALVQAHVP